MHDGARVRGEMHPLEAFQTAQRIAAARGRDEVKFDDLVTSAAARVGNSDLGGERIACGERAGR